MINPSYSSYQSLNNQKEHFVIRPLFTALSFVYYHNHHKQFQRKFMISNCSRNKEVLYNDTYWLNKDRTKRSLINGLHIKQNKICR